MTCLDSLATQVGAALQHRWAALQESNGPTTAFGSFEVDEIRDMLVVPLVANNSLLGALVLVGCAGRKPASARAERLALGAVGIAVAQTIERLIQRQQLELAVSRDVHEREMANLRKMIGRALHDGPTQTLALASLALDSLLQSMEEPHPVAAGVRKARALVDHALIEMRHQIGQVQSTGVPIPNLSAVCTLGLARVTIAQPTPCLSSRQNAVQLAPEVERAMIGIVREALHNVRKHADAESVRLEVRRVEEAVEIAVIDDGIGFEGPSPTGHFGLEQIRELAEEMGGRLETRSAPGAGTSVKAWIPLASPASSQRRRA